MPQKAYSFGFEYRDPDYWWIGATANYLDETYVDIAPLKRTENYHGVLLFACFSMNAPVARS